MVQENFEAWDEQALDPQDMPTLDDQSATPPQGGEDIEDDAEQASGAQDAVKKPVPAGRKSRKPRQKAHGSGAKAGEQGAESAAGEVDELEAQGFTHDEAIRLLHVSDRAATSGEALEAEATMRRLRFTRWLVERGMLDEWSA
jgi:hypothetical protein